MFMNYTNVNKNISIYFKEVQKNGNMTKKDEITLFRRIAKGDQTAETEIFNKLSKLAVAIAKLYTCDPYLLEDLIQEANMGILKAVKLYDIHQGYRFSSYARWWMKAYISKFLQEMGLVHPSSTKLINMANKIRESFSKTYGRDISVIELIDELESRGEVITDVTAILNVEHVMIDQVVDDDDNTKAERGEVAIATAEDNGFQRYEEEESLQVEVENALQVLNERERRLVKAYFGIGADFESSYDTIAKNEGLTSERVRQIIQNSLKKMRR